MGASAWRREKEERGGAGAVVGCSRWLAMAPDLQAWAAPLLREQRRAAGVGDADDGVSVTDGRDQGKAGPGCGGRGAREKRESETGRRWGTDMQARVARFKPDLKQNPNSNVLNNFKLFQTLVD
jgi:hypothetical protein